MDLIINKNCTEKTRYSAWKHKLLIIQTEIREKNESFN